MNDPSLNVESHEIGQISDVTIIPCPEEFEDFIEQNYPHLTHYPLMELGPKISLLEGLSAKGVFVYRFKNGFRINIQS